MRRSGLGQDAPSGPCSAKPSPFEKPMKKRFMMADSDSVQAKLLDKIEQALGKAQTPAALLALAEAFAWVSAPAQPHGGGKN
jgi:hypothetical protein